MNMMFDSDNSSSKDNMADNGSIADSANSADAANIADNATMADNRNMPAAANIAGASPVSAPLALPVARLRRRPGFTRRSTGKVGRLPLDVRNLVNNSLRGGRPYNEITSLLVAHGFPGVSTNNLSNWAKGGYRQWLDTQERFEAARALSPQSAGLLGQLQPEGRSELADLNESLLTLHFNTLLDTLDPSAMRQAPEQFVILARALTAYMAARAQRQRAELERHKYDLEIRKIAAAKDPANRPRALTAETIRQIEAAAKML